MPETMPQAQTMGSYTAIGDTRYVLATSDDLAVVVATAKQALADGRCAAAIVFDDATGKRTDVDRQETTESLQARLGIPTEADKRQGPGRPKLGVISREVSLLPRHWDWLGTQPGGASAALRRLVEAASKQNRVKDLARQQRDAAHAFMWLMGADKPGFEEASRALYSGDYGRLAELIETNAWPTDVQAHLLRLVAHVAHLDTLAH